jgi:hypothetical protein
LTCGNTTAGGAAIVALRVIVNVSGFVAANANTATTAIASAINTAKIAFFIHRSPLELVTKFPFENPLLKSSFFALGPISRLQTLCLTSQ